MKHSTKTIEFKFERQLPALPGEVYAAWLNPKIPGTPWHAADKLILNPTVDGFFYLLHGEYPHYGRFTRLEPTRRIQHTWVSPNTLGEESTVTLSFKKHGGGTLMSLLHSDLPNNPRGRAHKEGWNYYLGIFAEQFDKVSHKKK